MGWGYGGEGEGEDEDGGVSMKDQGYQLLASFQLVELLELLAAGGKVLGVWGLVGGKGGWGGAEYWPTIPTNYAVHQLLTLVNSSRQQLSHVPSCPSRLPPSNPTHHVSDSSLQQNFPLYPPI